ncbi:LytR family transcriptional regulator [Streptomyces sp. A7024]|uniref:LytR family transcriptional regulator n=1 Tax=Streptomyces coryli TaxID=1128680 RepID=A0A6G4TW95_9ACTN|nr:LCP family protein [Streptomyces coryli]NGN64255.1 LytR family transcriptional regulator [Streptomyces coryli]
MPSPRHARTARRPRRRRIAVWCGAVVLLVVVGGGAMAAYTGLSGNIATTDLHSRLGSDRPPRSGAGMNILVLGSDSRAGENQSYGAGVAGARSDTAMLVHVGAGRKSAAVVSVPRDTIVRRPACPLDGGGTAPGERAAMFNTAYGVGGNACTVKTVEGMSGIRVDHVMEIDFTGFKRLIDAMGGVRVTVPQAIHDPKSGLDLGKGTHRLRGEEALALVRTRYGIGDGSDLGRIRLQQKFMAALADQLKSEGLLGDPVRLYKVADAATSALTTDKELGSLSALLGLARSLKGVNPDAITFRTLPVRPYPADPNRVEPSQPAAGDLWQALREDKRLPPKS